MKPILKMSVLMALVVMTLAIAPTESQAQWYGSAGQMWDSPTQAQTDKARRDGPCNDPWVTIAIWRRFDRYPAGAGNEGECNIMLYNGGSWSSMAQLVDAVLDYKTAMQKDGARFGFVKVSDKDVRVALTYKDPVTGQNIVALGGGNIVALGGGNIVALGGGNLVGLNGANIVALGGGNFSVLSANSYSTQSGAKKTIKVGKAVIVVR